jgi:hypothetical protein
MDGGFVIFLLLMFVFWILEGIAKAKQRPRSPRLPDQSMPGSTSEQISAQGRRAPTQKAQRPPTLLELLAAEVERAREAQRQSEQGPARERAEPAAMSQDTAARKDPIEWHPVSAPTAKKEPPKRSRPLRRPPPRGSEPSRTAPHRPPPGYKGRAASPTRPLRSDLRAQGEGAGPGDLDVVEQFSERGSEERTSEAWASGVREADSGAAREGGRAAALEVERSASLEAAPRRTGLQRAGIKESQKMLEPAKARVPKPAARSLEPRNLVGASPAELRRILVLQEVLGPPVGLREDRENWEAPREVAGPARTREPQEK